MRLSAAVANARPIQVNFAEGAVLNVTYRPSKATPADLDRMAAEAEQADEENKKAGRGQRVTRDQVRQMVTSMSELIVAWDLTTDDDEPIDPTDPDALMDVPMPVFSGIMKAVNKDQTEGEADAPSDAG